MAQTRVIHLATSLNGGAGIAARRTHEALLSVGVDSKIYSLTGVNRNSDSMKLIHRSMSVKTLSSITTFIQGKFIQKTQKLVTPVSLEVFDPNLIDSEDFDVLHLHSFYNFLSIKQIRELAHKYSDRKLFVTLHDERILTGGCHYTGSCIQNQVECSECPQVHQLFTGLVQRKFSESRESFTDLNNVTLIAPSKWMAIKAQNSQATKKLNCLVIRNPIPDAFFSVARHKKATEKNRIVFISANLNNPLKGQADFVSALNALRRDNPKIKFSAIFVGIGEVLGLEPGIEFEIIETKNDSETAHILEKASLLVVPSYEDNLPSTMLEALATGVPVVGARVGGILEVLEQGKQKLFDPGNVKELTSAIRDSLIKPDFIDVDEIANEFSYSAVGNALKIEYTKTTVSER